MAKKIIYSIMFIVILCCFTACGSTKNNQDDYISDGIQKINASNSISIHFHSESITESNLKEHGVLDSDITFIKEPFTRYYESINSYYEDDNEKYKITYGSYLETVNGELKQYEKFQSTPNETPEWKLSKMDSESIKNLADYYRKELNAYVFMFSSNTNNFQLCTEEKLDNKAAIKFEGYFTQETASECIDKYLKESFQTFGSDFTEAHPLTRTAKSPTDTPVSIWFDKESGNPILIHINLTEADQFYRDSHKVPSMSAISTPEKVSDSSITIEIKTINNDILFPVPEGIPAE